jgi:hypothetical protein
MGNMRRRPIGSGGSSQNQSPKSNNISEKQVAMQRNHLKALVMGEMKPANGNKRNSEGSEIKDVNVSVNSKLANLKKEGSNSSLIVDTPLAQAMKKVGIAPMSNLNDFVVKKGGSGSQLSGDFSPNQQLNSPYSTMER